MEVEGIRNVCLLSHTCHGKSTLLSSLGDGGGPLTAQKMKGFTTRLVGNKVFYAMPLSVEREVRINILDTPGNAEFSAEVSAALRITDGGMVVVDYVDGVTEHCKELIRLAIREGVKLVVVINKLDKGFRELSVEGEEMYLSLSKVVKDVNNVLEEGLARNVVGPEDGTVAFASGVEGWAFTLETFAKEYAESCGIDEDKMIENLWGENFYDSATNIWTGQHTGSVTCTRGWVQFCYNPIKNKLDSSGDENELKRRLPLREAILQMTIVKLPTPAQAQRDRVNQIYEGPMDDVYANAIRNCDPAGPLMLYVSKMHPSLSKKKCFALCRVFSGQIAIGSKVRFLKPNYIQGNKWVCFYSFVEDIVLWGEKQQKGKDVKLLCGNIGSVLGFDVCGEKSATLTGEDDIDAHPMRDLHFLHNETYCYQVAVRCKKPSDHTKLVEAVKHLVLCDPFLKTISGIYMFGIIVSGAGKVHVDTRLKEIRDSLACKSVEINWLEIRRFGERR